MAFVEVKNLTKRYGATVAVKDLSFEIEEGEVFGLLGPNGAGKSTTLSVISGLLTPTSGDVVVAGHSVRTEAMAVKRDLGIVPQEPALYPRLSARVNLRFWGEMYGLGGKSLSARVDEILDLVGLKARAGEPLGRYSGGMKRRINLAAGLLTKPRLLILDEPTVGVDPQSRNRIFDLVKAQAAAGTTVIYTSHYMEEVELLCGRVAIVDQGSLVAAGTVSDLLKQASEHQEVEIGCPGITEDLVSRLESIPVVEQVRQEEQGVRLITDEAEKALALAFGCFVGAGARVSSIQIHKPNLEGLFIKLTGKSLRN
ncbi:MAG: ABC transporter ATP-binding protein [Bacillota bacterium]